ncbi:MAG: aminotransferase class V-fold PLP-dependent enzyme [Actinomycetota bacterium]|nr:aminotransferase class V-fold PLP-dependent enzyme [Actinomycetota bacterium]
MSELLEDRWAGWAARRPTRRVLHLDAAAAGRTSLATQRVVAQHMAREAELGAYVAQEQAAAVIESGRARIAGLFGLDPRGLAFVESATTAHAALLGAWPWGEHPSVAVLPGEWGQNRAAFRAHGLAVVELGANPDGAVDLDDLARRLEHDPPSVVHIVQVAAHRGLVQPVTEISALCQAAGVALWVDAAQAFGQAPTNVGADATYTTSRKWMCGPRGVGALCIAQRWWGQLRVTQPVLAAPDASAVSALESSEAHIAGRVGLATAVAEFEADGPEQIWRRLAEVGRMTREALADIPGWQVVDQLHSPCAVTALTATAGQSVFDVRRRLLEDHGVLTTAGAVARAPAEMTRPLLRISPHVDCTGADLQALSEVLATM